MLAILLSGYLLMLGTLGIYRFWLVTRKRRFYWSNTRISGESLEYTGTAMQLLLGFLFALLVFVPLYGFFFYLSTQPPDVAGLGYVGVAVFLFFLSGYAAYRARRFLLTRTLWRGIRFSLSGNAWVYAFKRFFWVFITIITAGLAYPLMVSSLWRYRYNNTWFGDRRFHMNGSWRTIAGPFYTNYFLVAGLLLAGILVAGSGLGEQASSSENASLPPLSLALFSLAGLVAFFAYFHLKARIVSRMLSTVTIGRARLHVRVRARDLFWQHFGYVFFISIATIGFGALVIFLMGDVLGPVFSSKQADLSEILRLGWLNLLVFGLLYLSLMAIFAILAELVFGIGYWRLVARGTRIENEQDLRTVRASGEESPLGGQGLADAMNVGAY